MFPSLWNRISSDVDNKNPFLLCFCTYSQIRYNLHSGTSPEISDRRADPSLLLAGSICSRAETVPQRPLSCPRNHLHTHSGDLFGILQDNIFRHNIPPTLVDVDEENQLLAFPDHACITIAARQNITNEGVNPPPGRCASHHPQCRITCPPRRRRRQ